MRLAELTETFGDKANSIVKNNISQDRGGKPMFFSGLTTTKLRGIYGSIMNIYTKVQDKADFESHRADIAYLKVKMAYAAGREPSVKTFIDKTELMNLVGDISTYEDFLLYCRYAESLVAYFKYYGGKDK
jgi:CRISPR-associated protein Csm2